MFIKSCCGKGGGKVKFRKEEASQKGNRFIWWGVDSHKNYERHRIQEIKIADNVFIEYCNCNSSTARKKNVWYVY